MIMTTPNSRLNQQFKKSLKILKNLNNIHSSNKIKNEMLIFSLAHNTKKKQRKNKKKT